MELAIVALGAIIVAVYAVRHPAHAKTATPVDPYTAWMVANLPRLRSWRR